MTLRLYITDTIKSYLITAILMSIFFSMLEKIISVFGNSFFIFLWVAFIVLMLIIITLYPTVIAPLFNKFENLNEEIPKEKELLDKI